MIRPHLSEEKLIVMGCDTKDKMMSMAQGIAEHTVSQKRADEWIGSRTLKVEELVNISAKECISEWLSNESFK